MLRLTEYIFNYCGSITKVSPLGAFESRELTCARSWDPNISRPGCGNPPAWPGQRRVVGSPARKGRRGENNELCLKRRKS